ncbi:MAG: LysR family transcriptional regulator [Oscillospiraceae bacterium]|nr:LysR family transcriptional regulator [Oscillospiraceae bacterium]
MELGQLVFFVAAAESGSFSKTAAEHYVSHSTVSRSVSALEQELGTALFERGNRSLRLTPAGEKLLPRAKELLRLAEELRSVL